MYIYGSANVERIKILQSYNYAQEVQPSQTFNAGFTIYLWQIITRIYCGDGGM